MKRILGILMGLCLVQQAAFGMMGAARVAVVGDHGQCYSVQQLCDRCNANDLDCIVWTYNEINEILVENGLDQSGVETYLKYVRKELFDRCNCLSVKLTFYRGFGIKELYSDERTNDEDCSVGCSLLGV
ncbi:MAG: hypothetical protein WCT20_02365 [Candidatus Babeliales bacterium]